MSLVEKIGWKKLLLTILFAIVLLASVYFAYKHNKVGTILSAAGSIASLYAIIISLFEVKSIQEETENIKKAVENKTTLINKQETCEQINKHIETINMIVRFVSNYNADAALIKIESLQVFYHSLLNNPTTSDDVKKMITKHQRALKMDIDVLRELQQGSNAEKLDTKILTHHLDEAKDTLMMISQQIHFDR